MIALFFCIVLIYLAEHALNSIGVFRAMRAPDAGSSRDPNVPSPAHHGVPPLCTILVCARDEEQNIERCLNSLAGVNYPQNRLQILVVDDKSTDRTPEILQEWKVRMPNLEVLRTGDELLNLRGKVNALAQGMDVAEGEFVMITDADCRVPPNWVKEYLKYYREDTGMVAAIPLLEVKYLLDGVQSIDWSYTLALAMAGANLNFPISVIGNNISVRRAAYEDVGGYRKIPFSVTEDYALFQAIWHKKPWKVRFPLHKDLMATSQPCPNFRMWWRQKHRWVKGGESLKFIGYVFLISAMLGNLAMITAFIFLPIPTALCVIAIKWAADLLIIAPTLARLRKWTLIKFFPLYEVYLALFVVSIPVMMMQKNVKWKGRVYKQ